MNQEKQIYQCLKRCAQFAREVCLSKFPIFLFQQIRVKDQTSSIYQEIEELRSLVQTLRYENEFYRKRAEYANKANVEREKKMAKFFGFLKAKDKTLTQTNKELEVKLKKAEDDLARSYEGREGLSSENEKLLSKCHEFDTSYKVMEEKRLKLEHANKSLQEDLEKAQHEYKKLDDSTIVLENEYLQLYHANKRLQEDLENTQLHYYELYECGQELENEYLKLYDANDRLQEDLESAKRENKGLLWIMEQNDYYNERESDELQEQVARLEKQVARLDEDLMCELWDNDENRNKSEYFRRELEKLKVEKQSLENDIVVIREEKAKIGGVNNRIKRKNKLMKTRFGRMKKIHFERKNKLQRSQEELNEKREEINTKNHSIIRLVREKKDLQKQTSLLVKNIDLLRGENKNLRKEVRKDEKKLKEEIKILQKDKLERNSKNRKGFFEKFKRKNTNSTIEKVSLSQSYQITCGNSQFGS